MIARILISILLIALINVVCIIRIYFFTEIKGKAFMWIILITNAICLIVAVLYIVGIVGS